jgi:hypothetical protein
MNWKRWNRLKQPWSEEEREWLNGWCMGPGGNGDLLYNTARKIIEENYEDRMDEIILADVFRCLSEGKRWPNDMNELITTTNHKQTDLTKDPWIMAYCCAVHLDRFDLIREYPPPTKPVKTVSKKWRKWSYFLSWEYAWYKELIGQSRAYSRFWRHIIPIFGYFVNHTYVLIGFMNQAYEQSKKK